MHWLRRLFASKRPLDEAVRSYMKRELRRLEDNFDRGLDLMRDGAYDDFAEAKGESRWMRAHALGAWPLLETASQRSFPDAAQPAPAAGSSMAPRESKK